MEVVRERSEGELRVAHDDAQHVVEVVRDAPGEAPYGLQPLRLLELKQGRVSLPAVFERAERPPNRLGQLREGGLLDRRKARTSGLHEEAA